MSSIKCFQDCVLRVVKYHVCSAMAAGATELLLLSFMLCWCPCDKAASRLRASCAKKQLLFFCFTGVFLAGVASRKEGTMLNACGCGGTVAALI